MARTEQEQVVPSTINLETVHAILARVDAMPVLDKRSHDQIMRELYGEQGLP